MPPEIFDELPPLVPILRRRDAGLVPKRMRRRRVRGQFARHEAQFHKRADAIFEQPVVNLVNVRKIVNGIAGIVFVVKPYLVMENGVKPDVFEAGDALHFAKIAAVAFAQRDDGAFRAEHALPKMWKGMSRSR